MLIVQKFGGTSVDSTEKIINIANRIVDLYKKNNQIIVVLSAQGNTTNELIDKAHEIDLNASKREIDMLISTGEQQSVALMCIAIEKLGIKAVSLNATQVNIASCSNYGCAEIISIDTSRMKKELLKNKIVLITGFQGIDEYNNITTLGRGGSDTTAVAIAAAMNADLCEIYTDVDGVYSADPRYIKNAFKVEEITYDEMLELSTLGAKVLHNRSVKLAKKYKINLIVKSSLNNNEGTIVRG